MFELSDDDDEFWEDLPLLDVTKKIESKSEVDIASKRQCLEKENIQSENDCINGGVKKQVRTQSGALPTPVLSNFTGTNLQQSAHGNRITCGFFTPVKSPDERSSNNSDILEPRKQGVEVNDSISSEIVDTPHHGLNTPRGITHVEFSTQNIQRGITHGEPSTPNMPRSVTHGEPSTPNISRGLTYGEQITPNIPKRKTPGNTLSPGTPAADMNVPGNVRASSVPQEIPGRRGKRKFPGPAGRLPKLKPGEVMNKSTAVSPESENKGTTDVIMCSQMNDDVFNESSWKLLKQDLGPDAEIILDQFSVSSSLTMASKKTLPQGKIPLLFVIVESLDLQGAGGSVVLKDKTGRIKGTLHRDVIKEYGADIQPGTTLVLRQVVKLAVYSLLLMIMYPAPVSIAFPPVVQVGVVSPTNRTHYLNITPTNMVYLNSNASNVNRHLFHHHSLKHFMADFKRKCKQEQLVQNGNLMLSTPQRCSNRMIPSVNLSTPVICQKTSEHMPMFASHGVRALTPNSGARVMGISTPRPLLSCYQRATTPNSVNSSRLSENFGGNMIQQQTLNQRATTPNSVNSRLGESFGGNMIQRQTLNQRATTPNSVNSRLAAPIKSTPVGNITPRSTLNVNQIATTPNFNFNQRNTTTDHCLSGSYTKEILPPDFHNLGLRQPSNISQQLKGNLMHETCENSKFTDIRNSSHGYINKTNSIKPITTEQSSSSRIVPTFGKKKTNQDVQLASKVTPSFPCSVQNKENFSVSKISSNIGNNPVVTPKTSKFSFKSKTPSVSPGVKTPVLPCQVPWCQKTTSSNKTDPVDCDSLWQDDDISDEMLTHLTEDMP
ncbi:hypothetical protein LOTGIDRAFT_238375 [Lottia gigantea]|uniref:Homologous recombination OB-fold protein OB-fold domain-containing protein n=1 Tax=Lottia gigantea TaxID=225164 RepID=V4B4V3_LOTGI|nr:hypothetical protein LOTGIDRAFT_238375 [Lottia gigantea]ESP01002.1 hypothetical protein LOTGIDRAFT_238375 [Lottia gigantea]